MSVENDPYVQAMLELNKKTTQDIAMMRAVFVRDALASKRYTPGGMADFLEDTCSGFMGYEGSMTEVMVGLLREGKGPHLQVIEGGKED